MLWIFKGTEVRAVYFWMMNKAAEALAALVAEGANGTLDAGS